MQRPGELHRLKYPAIALVISAAYSVGWASTVQAVQIDFSFPDGMPSEVTQGFEDAGQLWSSFLRDDVVVNLDVQYQPFNSNSLSSLTPQRANFIYRDVIGALRSDISSPSDAISFTSLPKSGQFDMLLDPAFNFDLLINGTADNPNGSGSMIPYLDSDGDCNNRSLRLTTANAKALGLPITGNGTCGFGNPAGINDGRITINSNFEWDFDASDGISATAFDFVGIASQGIGVILGATSGIGVLDFSTLDPNGPFDDGLFPFVSLQDLHRFSAESFDRGVIDWTMGRTDGDGEEVDKYFSIDGGQTPLASFSTGVFTGDGYPTNFWKDDELGGTTLGILEPTPVTGQLLQFSETDQVLFDVLGWDLADPGNPPRRFIKVDDPNDPEDPSDPGDPGDPGDPDDPGDPGNPTAPSDPGDPTDPVDSGDPADPKSIPEPSSVLALFPVVWMGVRWIVKRRARKPMPSSSKTFVRWQ